MFLHVDYDQFNILVNKEIEKKRKLRFIDCCFEFCDMDAKDYENIDELENEIMNVVIILSKKYRKS